jgi:hypothetical protein
LINQDRITNGNDYAGLPSSLLWPLQIFTTIDGQIQEEKMVKFLANNTLALG